MSFEEKRLLSGDNDVSSNGDLETGHKPRISRLKAIFPSIIIHFILIILYTTISILVINFNCPVVSTSLHSIKGLEIRYHPQTYTDFIESPYAGLPSPELDKAWQDLLAPIDIRISAAEMQRSNQTSVELPEGGGYMAWLGVYHELHCVKLLRQWNYREHYHPEVTEKDRPHWDIHADHCLDILRSAAMCHADTTLTTFGWAEKSKPMLNTRPIEHKCVDWNALMDSVKDRVIGEEEVGALVNPNL